MIERYMDPAINSVMSDSARYERWRWVALSHLAIATEKGMVPETALAQARATPAPTMAEVTTMEQETGHDLVAFIQAWTATMPDQRLARFVHHGMTSSDVVDTAHFTALVDAAKIIEDRAAELARTLQADAIKYKAAYRLGRTHGQAAEPTSWGLVLHNMAIALEYALLNLQHTYNHMPTWKVPGAVGTDPFGRNDWRFHRRFGKTAGAGSQVVGRDVQYRWAAAVVDVVLVCERIAMEVRLSSRSEVREVREGAVRIGSSAMPHKHNPIQAENISGLARVARGMLSPIMETVTLHHERDISNSSVERTAVVDLAHLAATIARRTNRMMVNLEVDTQRMQKNLNDAWWYPYSSMLLFTLVESTSQFTYTEAHAIVRESLTRRALLPYMVISGEIDDLDERDAFIEAAKDRCNPKWMLRNVLTQDESNNEQVQPEDEQSQPDSEEPSTLRRAHGHETYDDQQPREADQHSDS